MESINDFVQMSQFDTESTTRIEFLGMTFYYSGEHLIAFRIPTEDQMFVSENVFQSKATTGHLNRLCPDPNNRRPRDIFLSVYRKKLKKQIREVNECLIRRRPRV